MPDCDLLKAQTLRSEECSKVDPIVPVATLHMISLSRITLSGFITLAMGSSVCFARTAVEQITKSGVISDRLRYVAIILVACLPRLLRGLS